MSSSQVDLKKRLSTLMNKPENNTCVDCCTNFPLWASIILPPPDSPPECKPLGVFCCDECSQTHRDLGSSICIVRNVIVDEWQEHEVVAIEKSDNKNFNKIFEAKNDLAQEEKPFSEDDVASRVMYVRNKYEHLKYFDPVLYARFWREGADAIQKSIVASIMGKLEQVRNERGGSDIGTKSINELLRERRSAGHTLEQVGNSQSNLHSESSEGTEHSATSQIIEDSDTDESNSNGEKETEKSGLNKPSRRSVGRRQGSGMDIGATRGLRRSKTVGSKRDMPKLRKAGLERNVSASRFSSRCMKETLAKPRCLDKRSRVVSRRGHGSELLEENKAGDPVASKTRSRVESPQPAERKNSGDHSSSIKTRNLDEKKRAKESNRRNQLNETWHSGYGSKFRSSRRCNSMDFRSKSEELNRLNESWHSSERMTNGDRDRHNTPRHASERRKSGDNDQITTGDMRWKRSSATSDLADEVGNSNDFHRESRRNKSAERNERGSRRTTPSETEAEKLNTGPQNLTRKMSGGRNRRNRRSSMGANISGNTSMEVDRNRRNRRSSMYDNISGGTSTEVDVHRRRDHEFDVSKEEKRAVDPPSLRRSQRDIVPSKKRNMRRSQSMSHVSTHFAVAV